MAKVLLKKSSVSSNAPGTGDLEYGELAINYADGRLYYKNSSNVIKNFVDSDTMISEIVARVAGITDVVQDTTPQLGGDLETNGNDITFGNNDKALFGAGSDLQIYHDGSNSTIADNGTGVLELRTNGTEIQITGNSGTDYMARFVNNGGVNLYYDHSLKIETTNTGVDVTGNITVSGTVDGRDVAADGTKLDNIEDGATGDQTASEILTLIKTVDGDSSGLDADLLDGQHGSYYAPLASPGLTGTPTAPTAAAGTNTTQIATTAFVSTAVSNLVDTAPSTLDTLNELAAALGDDPNFATTVSTNIGTKVAKTGDTMSGALQFSSAGQTFIRGVGSNSDTTLIRISSGNIANDSADYGFSINYMGTRTGNDNSLSFFADNQNGVQVEAFAIKQDGSLWQGELANQIFHDGYHPNADKWTTGRTITLTGDVTGVSGSFDGSGNLSFATSIASGSIINTDINDSAAIADTKLATISTAGKVSNSATTATSANTASAIVARDASGNFSAGTITASLSGNATTASALATARDIALSGDVTGSASFDGSGNIEITATVGDDTHNHTIANVDGLDSALDNKLALAGGTMTGSLTINANDASITLNDTSGNPTDQGIRIRAESIDVNLPGSEGLGIIFEESPTNGSPDTTPAIITTGQFYAQSDQKVFHDSYHPNADQWTTARTIILAGDLSGSVGIDGSADVTLTATVSDGSGSGLDADLLDGQEGSYYRIDVYDASGTLLN